MKFQIMCLADQSLLRDEKGALILYEHGEDAAAKAKELTEAQGHKWQPRPLLEGDWRKREAQRLINGTYTRLPWHDQTWAEAETVRDTFPHVSNKFPGKVAFTLNEANGDRDIQTAMRAGRYLTRFYGNVLSKHAIKHWTAHFAALYEDNKLLIATTEDEIVEIYTATHETGAGSCMSYPVTEYSTDGIHPVSVYGDSDLALAYFCVDGKIAARALIWPEKKTHSRVYGDIDRMEQMLAEAGYEPAAPIGAKLQLKTNRNGRVICPYIDRAHESGGGQLGVEFDGGHLVISRSGRGYVADYDTGLITLSYRDGHVIYDDCDDYHADDDEGPDNYCQRCERDEYSENMVRVYDGRNSWSLWCDSCASDEDYAVTCRNFDYRVEIGSAVEMEANSDNPYWWTVWRFESHGFQCQCSNDNYPDDEAVSVWFKGQHHSYCENWARHFVEENAVQCAITKRWHHHDAIVELPDGRLVGYDTNEAKAFAEEEDKETQSCQIEAALQPDVSPPGEIEEEEEEEEEEEQYVRLLVSSRENDRLTDMRAEFDRISREIEEIYVIPSHLLHR